MIKVKIKLSNDETLGIYIFETHLLCSEQWKQTDRQTDRQTERERERER